MALATCANKAQANCDASKARKTMPLLRCSARNGKAPVSRRCLRLPFKQRKKASQKMARNKSQPRKAQFAARNALAANFRLYLLLRNFASFAFSLRCVIRANSTRDATNNKATKRHKTCVFAAQLSFVRAAIVRSSRKKLLFAPNKINPHSGL